MKLYDFLFTYLEEFNYTKNQWYDVPISKLDKQERTKLWSLFKKTYSKEMYDDMIFGNSMDKFYEEYKNAFIIDVDDDKKMDAFVIYKISGNYKKISLLGANRKGKKELINKLLSLLDKSGWFIEASLKIENILKKSMKPITNEKLIKKVLSHFSNKEINYTIDGSYERKVSGSGKIIKKIMYGNLNE